MKVFLFMVFSFIWRLFILNMEWIFIVILWSCVGSFKKERLVGLFIIIFFLVMGLFIIRDYFKGEDRKSVV